MLSLHQTESKISWNLSNWEAHTGSGQKKGLGKKTHKCSQKEMGLPSAWYRLSPAKTYNSDLYSKRGPSLPLSGHWFPSKAIRSPSVASPQFAESSPQKKKRNPHLTGKIGQRIFSAPINGLFGTPLSTPNPPRKLMWVPFWGSFPGNQAHKLPKMFFWWGPEAGWVLFLTSLLGSFHRWFVVGRGYLQKLFCQESQRLVANFQGALRNKFSFLRAAPKVCAEKAYVLFLSLNFKKLLCATCHGSPTGPESSWKYQGLSAPNRAIWLRLRFVIRIANRKSLAIWGNVILLRKAHSSDYLLYEKLALRF